MPTFREHGEHGEHGGPREHVEHGSTPARPACPVCRRLDRHDNVFCFRCYRSERAGTQDGLEAEAAALPFMRPLGTSPALPEKPAGCDGQEPLSGATPVSPGPAGRLTAGAIAHRWRMLSHLSALRRTASGGGA